MMDFRFAFRQLLKTPGFSSVAVLTLAVGIGCSCALFSALCALVLEPFSYPQSERIVQLWSNEGQPFSTLDYYDMREQTTVFEHFGAYKVERVNLGGENAQSLRAVLCTSDVLRAFGVAPALGRFFEPADEVAGAAPVVILSHRMWKDTFAGKPDIVGSTLRLNGGSATVVGVMPASFEFVGPWLGTTPCQVWKPLELDRANGDRGSHWMCVVARLKEGKTVGSADAEVKTVGRRLQETYPNSNTGKPFLARSLHEEMTRSVRSSVWMLFTAVILVLLVACANVSSMLLARNAKRQSEVGVRVALGASMRHILGLSLCESLLLSLAGSLLGLGFGLLGIQALKLITPASEMRKAAMVLDGRVLLFAIGLCLLSALLAGLPPAFAAMRISVADMLRTDSRGAAGSRTRHRLLRGLIIVQVALAFVLANSAALFSTSYLKLLKENEAIASPKVLSVEISLKGERYAKEGAAPQFLEQLTQRLSNLPGVESVGTSTMLPLEGGSNTSIMVNDEVFDPTKERVLAEVSAATPGYFAAAGIPLLRGRVLGPEDVGKESIGVVVNRALAEQCWPKEDPLGKIIRPNADTPWYRARVVGVVENVRQWGPHIPPRPEMYWTVDRAWGQRHFVLLRSFGNASQMTTQVRKEIAAMDPDLAISRPRTLEDVVYQSTQQQRTMAGIVDFFMALALGLVAIGLFGTLSYYVLQNTREIGVRMALGAFPSDIVKQILRQGFAWVSAGIVLGLLAAWLLGLLLKSLIYGVGSMNPLVLLGATAAVAFATLLACWLPARRAASVDPLVALRSE